jgi:hypothetical protein
MLPVQLPPGMAAAWLHEVPDMLHIHVVHTVQGCVA